MAFENLKIIRLEAENIKRIRAVDITPKGDVITVSGKNGQGKTSVLDSILWALGGERPIQWKPIREGEAKASIVLDIGDETGLKLQVTRRFTKQEDGSFTTSLKVTNEDGFRPQGEQGLLNALVGSLSFDPTAFTRAKDDDQVKMLKALIPGDFSSIATRRAKLVLERTEKNREADRLKATAASFSPPEGIGTELLDTAELEHQLAQLGTAWRDHEQAKAVRAQTQRDIDTHYAERDRMRSRAEALRNQAADLDEAANDSNAAGVALEKDLAELSPLVEPASAADIQDQLNDMRGKNRVISLAIDHAKTLSDAEVAVAESKQLTEQIQACDQEVLDLVAAAELPVRGLSLTEETVMLRGVPFSQASDAEQLRASMALAMAANPKLRVIRIRDGSLLDDDALAVIREVAHAENFQIWMERVGTAGGPEEIVMEDGAVKEA